MLSIDYAYAQKNTRHLQNSALMAEGNPKNPKIPTKQLSALPTQITLSNSRAQANPTVKRGPNHKVRIKKLPKDKAKDKSTQT